MTHHRFLDFESSYSGKPPEEPTQVKENQKWEVLPLFRAHSHTHRAATLLLHSLWCYILMGHQTFPPKQFNNCYYYLKLHEQRAQPLSAALSTGFWVAHSLMGAPCLYGNLPHKSQLGENHRIITAGKGFWDQTIKTALPSPPLKHVWSMIKAQIKILKQEK